MSYMGQDPGDITPSEMWGREPMPQADGEGTLVWKAPCPTCSERDGGPNVEYLDENGQCTFGCGSVIDNDYKVCRTCQDHSANEVECENCGTHWTRWSDRWEKAT